MIKYVDDLDDLKGVRVLLRLDLNVPIEHSQVRDAYRIERIIQTIDFLREKEAQIIILAHIEDEEGNNISLLPVWNYLNGFFPVDFSPTYFDAGAIEKIAKLEDKGVLLFENIRNNKGEKENDVDFAKKLSQMGDIYVNDAFAVSHRKHASIVGVPQFLPHFGGLLLREEIEHLSKVFKPEHPFVFLLGGAKFETKFPLAQKYLEIADTVFVGGALGNDIFKHKGFEVGKSRVSEKVLDIKDIISNSKLALPLDVTVQKPDGSVSFKKPNEVLIDESIMDAGPETITYLKNILKDAKTVVWNGPLGNYENGFADKTEQLAEIISESSTEKIVGGDDTVAVIEKLGLNEKFTFVSTGGGAMLDFLVNETLPGIEVLEK